LFDLAGFHVLVYSGLGKIGAILSRAAALQGGYLLDHELRVFVAAILVNVESESKLDCAAIGWPGLIERDRINDVAAARRPYSQFEVFLADDPLLDNREISAPH